MSDWSRSPPTVRVDGDAIRRLREEKALTQLYVAEVAGVSVDTVSRWENNRTPAVKRENALAIAKALEVDLEAILQAPPPVLPAEEPPPPGGRRWVLVAAVGAALAAAGAAYLILAPSPPQIVSYRRLPPYAPPGSTVPVVLELRFDPTQGRRVILREHLPAGWTFLSATVAPDQGPGPDGTLKWIVPLAGTVARVAYAARAPAEALEGSAFPFSGEVIMADGGEKEFSVRGERRIDMEFVHWADQNADFHLGDAEVLDALERMEAAHGLPIDPSDLRRLWGAREYEWDRSAKEFRLRGPAP